MRILVFNLFFSTCLVAAEATVAQNELDPRLNNPPGKLLPNGEPTQPPKPKGALIMAEPIESLPSNRTKRKRDRRGKLLIQFGYTHSRWSDFDSAINNGSLLFSVGIGAAIKKSLELELSMDTLTGKSDNSGEEQIFAYYGGFGGRYLFNRGNFRVFSGLKFNVGAYRVWNISSESDTSITYQKRGQGILFGLAPELGLRVKFQKRFSSDLIVKYNAFLDSPESSLSGTSILAGFNFGY